MAKLKYIALITLGIILSISSYAQDNLFGKVVDENGIALLNAEVYWDTNKETDRDKQVTRPDGTFTIGLKKDSTISLNIRYPGTKDVKKYISEAEHNEFILIKMVEKGVTSVTASRWEQSIYDIPASTVIISKEEIAQNGYLTLQEILENVPGLFTIDHRSENGITMGVRGFWSDVNRNVMIQVNGVNMISERWMDFGFDKINVAVEAIDKIEIVRGPMNVIYGSGAFFGVINIITNDNQGRNNGLVATGFGLQSRNNGKLLSGFGSSGTGFSGIQKNVFSYSGGKDGFDFSFNAMTYQRGGFSEVWDDMIDSASYSLDSANGTEIRKERYSKKHRALNLSVGYNGFFANLNFAASDLGVSFWGHPGPGDRNDYKSYTGNYQVGYRGGTRNDRFNWEVKGSYMKSNTIAEMKYLDDDAFSYGEDRNSTLRSEFNTRTNLIGTNERPDFRMDLLAGLYFSRNFENNSFYNLPDWKLRNWYVGLAPGSRVDTKAAYVQTEVKIKNWVIVGGLRAEHEGGYKILNYINAGFNDPIGNPLDTINLDYSKISDSVIADRFPTFIPRLAVIYKIPTTVNGSAHFFKAMYGKAFREPNAPKNAGDVMVPNYNNNTEIPYLGAEKITTYELGYTFVHKPVGMEINANLFWNNLDALIVTESVLIDDKFIGFSKNSGKRRTYGVELIAQKKFSVPLKNSKQLGLIANLSGTFQKTEALYPDSMDIKNTDVSFSPAMLGTANITGKYKKFSFGIGGNYVGKMNAYTPDPSYIKTTDGADSLVIAQPIGDPIDGYFRFTANFRLDNIRFFNEKTGGFYFNFKVDNLLNKKYHYPTYSTVSWAVKGILGRGRQSLLSIGYSF